MLLAVHPEHRPEVPGGTAQHRRTVGDETVACVETLGPRVALEDLEVRRFFTDGGGEQALPQPGPVRPVHRIDMVQLEVRAVGIPARPRRRNGHRSAVAVEREPAPRSSRRTCGVLEHSAAPLDQSGQVGVVMLMELARHDVRICLVQRRDVGAGVNLGVVNGCGPDEALLREVLRQECPSYCSCSAMAASIRSTFPVSSSE